MSAQRIRLIIAMMSLALLGIISLQIYWIKWSIRLNEEQFDKNVYAALNRVGDKLQYYEEIAVLLAVNSSHEQSNAANQNIRRAAQYLENGFAARQMAKSDSLLPNPAQQQGKQGFQDVVTAYEYIKNCRGKILELSNKNVVKVLSIEEYEDLVKNSFSKTPSKQKRLLMEDIPDAFIERQINDTRYISKYVKNLLSNIVREDDERETSSKNLISSNGTITSTLKQDWGLNEVWNDIITPRFIRLNEMTNSNDFGNWTLKEGKKVFQTQVPLNLQKGFNKKRIDHRHHALDALVVACASRSHINYLNNSYAKSKQNDLRFDLRNKLCYKKYNTEEKDNYKWMFYTPWNNFTLDAKLNLDKVIVSFKQNLRVINKTVNSYQKWIERDGLVVKQFAKQKSGDNWAIRKSMHKDTVSGEVSLKFKKEGTDRNHTQVFLLSV
jgi:CRISPR-associated endonuclease Csn1